jgi:uncharacterized protein DUF4184
MPMTFPAHQGLILPVARKWPNSFDALALSVGAAMPDITDTVLGFLINGYFKQWYGHSLIGIFTFDLWGGLFITAFMAAVAGQISKYRYLPPPLRALLGKTQPNEKLARGHARRNGARLRLWSISVLVGILSHIGFDLLSHDTNLLFHPWHKNVRWYPKWWYRTWFEIRPLRVFGRDPNSVGVHSVIWGMFTLLGIFLFVRFLRVKKD